MSADKVRPCSSCKALILFARSPVGNVLPLDARPLTGEGDGRLTPRVVLYRLLGENAVTVSRAAVGSLAPLFVSHFVSCPSAGQHSKKRPAARQEALDFAP